LAFSRQQVLQPKVFNLDELVAEAEKMLRRVIAENIEIVTHASRNLGAVKADPRQIESVIMNLAVNARDAMPRGGTLTIETANVELDQSFVQHHIGARQGPHVMLAVSDTGMGMDRETMAHIFEPFFTTKEVGKGTGLGLSSVYGTVKQSGGSIWVYSEPEKGTTFKVFLPRVDEPTEALSGMPKVETAKPGTETILLVEDDPQLNNLAREILEMRGYRVLVAYKPLDVPAMCDEYAGEIDLLLTDVVMPGLSGSDLATQVVARRPRIKVLFMSGYTDTAVLHQGTVGEDAFFLQKPFTPSSLTEKVREILDRNDNQKKTR
jgi:DNA-binding response OmpR family regulator